MLNAFVCSGGQLQRLADTAQVEPLRRAVWIDLLCADRAEIDRVRQATGLDVPTEAEVSEIETSSRLATRNGTLYLSMPLIAMDTGPPRGVSAGFVLSPERLITVRFAPSRIFDNYAEHPPRGEARHDAGATILVGLLEALVDREADVLEHVRAELDAISHAIFAMGIDPSAGRKREDATLRLTLGQLGRIGDLLSHVRETQVAITRIVPYIEATAAQWLPKDLTPRLTTLRQDIASLSDYGTHLNEKLQFMLDATLGFINIAQNNVMKVMAIASVVGIPPVLIAGVYGMNFKNIPEYNWEWGYAWGWALIVLTALIPLAVFRWRRWI